jgi:P27 family predicted phage terminase small subunit
MGRRRADPADQKAQGYPGRRKSKTDRELERMARRAERDAKLFAEAGKSADLQALPIFLADRRLAAATTIWREYAPRLDKLHLLTTLDRYTFAMFCIYAAEFVLANRDVLDKGYTIMVTTVAGAMSKAKQGTQMPRVNPSVDRRDHAAKMMLDLAEKFGFTPADRNKLIRDHAMRADEETLFGRIRSSNEPVPAQPSPSPAAPVDEPGTLIGTLDRFDTPSPGKMN